MKSLTFALMLLTFLPSFGSAKSVGLVIGNDEYENISSLKIAVADAKAHAAHLRNERGFDEVIYIENASRKEMSEGFFRFLSALSPGDVAMLVYAGHGVQLDPDRADSLFLLPTDLIVSDLAPGIEALQIQERAIQFSKWRRAVSARKVQFSIFVLDSCRDNPLGINLSRNVGSRGVSRAQNIRFQASGGDFIFYSAGEGQVAYDRLNPEDANSPFTTAFLNIFRKNVRLEDVANRLQALLPQVTAEMPQPQRPAYVDNIEGYACLEGLGGCGDQQQRNRLNDRIQVALAERTETLLKSAQFAASKEDHPSLPQLVDELTLHSEINTAIKRREMAMMEDLYNSPRLFGHPKQRLLGATIVRTLSQNACEKLIRYGASCPTELRSMALSPLALYSPQAEQPPSPTKVDRVKAYVKDTDERSLAAVSKLDDRLVLSALRSLDHLASGSGAVSSEMRAKAIRSFQISLDRPQTGTLGPDETVALIKIAAEEDFEIGAVLGILYLEGQGVSTDRIEGLKLLRQARDLGSKYARTVLENLE